MASNNIGNAALVLSSNGSQVLGDLKQTGAGIKSWATGVQSTLTTTLKGAGAGAAGGIAGGMLGGLKGSLVGIGAGIGTLFGPVGTAVGGAIGGVVSTVVGAITEPFDKLKELGGLVREAGSLGVSASQYQGLTQQLKRVGIEGDAATATFAKLGKKVSDAAAGNGEAATAFANLGLNAQQLLTLPLDEQFKQVADAIAQLPPGAQQAGAAMKLFEESGARLLPVLQKGGSGIQEFIERQKKVGAVLSDSQLKAAADAGKAWKESRDTISAVWDGLVNRATLIAAPIIKFVGGVVSKAFGLLTPVFDWLGRAIGEAARILEAVFDVLAVWFDEAVKWFQELIGQVEGFTGSWPSVEDVVLAVLKGVAQALGYVWDTLKAGAGIGAFVIGFLVEGFGKLVGAFKNTIKDLLDVAAELPDDLGGDFFKRASANVEKFGGKIKDTGAEMKKWGKEQIAGWGDSPVKIGAWFDRLKDRAKKEDKKEAVKPAPGDVPQEYKAVAAALKGSKEAYSIESRFRFDPGNKKKVDEQQLDEAKKLVGKVEALLDIFRQTTPLLAG